MVVSKNIFKSGCNVVFEGYAWQTNQYGLAIDNIVAYELVKPNGQVVKVTAQSDAELFFGLKVIYLLCPIVDNSCSLLTRVALTIS